MFRPRINWMAIIVLFTIFTIFISFILIDFRFKASILEIAKSKAQVSGVERINRIINDKIVSNIEYKDIVNVHKDDDGKIVLIQPNTIILNKIMAETTIEVSKSLGRMHDETISIPMGQLTGSKLLAGYGPRIKVKIIPAGEVHVEVLNKFEQAGINQTRHLIYFKVDNNLKVAVPFLDDEVEVSTTIPLAETIIVGDVPRTYVNYNNDKASVLPIGIEN